MTCLTYLTAACVLAGTLAISTEPPPPTTTLAEESTDTPTPGSPSNTTKEKGTNRILNYGLLAGSSFGVFGDDLHVPGHQYPPPPPPYLPAPGPILPSHPPLPPYNGVLPSTGSCKYYCPGRWHNEVYCCDNSPPYPAYRCPRVRDQCPGKHYARHVRFCSGNRACAFGEVCCPDACLQYRHVCKTPERR